MAKTETAKTGMAMGKNVVDQHKNLISAHCPTCKKQVIALYSKPHTDGVHLLYACRECMKEMLITDPTKKHLAVN